MPNDKNRLLGALHGSSKRTGKVVKKQTNSSSLSNLMDKRNKKTRKSISFEEDDGFVFKRNSSADAPQATRKEQEEQVEVPKKKRGRPRKKEVQQAETIESAKPKVQELKKQKKVSKTTLAAQIETPSEDEDQAFKPTAKRKVGKKKKESTAPKRFSLAIQESLNKTLPQSKKHKVEPPVSPPISSPAFDHRNNNDLTYEEHETSLQMTLPLSDSPDKRRRKKDREKSLSRRSSLSNRGKRVSSIGNGFVAVPHRDVPEADFYKHLDENLPEPHKMRRLLIWCSKRLLSDENIKMKQAKSKMSSSEDLTAFNIAKVIKEEIIRDLVDGRLNTSWYNRIDMEEEENDISGEDRDSKPVKLVANPQNSSNAANIKLFEQKLEDLKLEKAKWETVMARLPQSIENPPTYGSTSESDLAISKELSDLTSRFEEFQKQSISTKSLEYKIDTFQSLVNDLNNDDLILTKLQTKLKARINHIMAAYTSPEKFAQLRSLDQNKGNVDELLKGISRIEGSED